MIQRMLSLMLVAFLGAAALTAAHQGGKPPDPGPPGKSDGGGHPDNPGNKPPEPPKGKPETPPGKPHPPVPPLASTVYPPPVDNPVLPGTGPGQADGPPAAFTPLPVTTMPGLVAPVRDATYAERAVFSADGAWQGRCVMAAMTVVQDVLAESENTPNHAARLKMAGQVMRDPDLAARRLARWLAAVVPVKADSRGYTASPVTDAQLRALVQQHWSALGGSLGLPF